MLGMSIVFWSISSRWSVKIIDENAFCKVKLQRISVKLSYLSTTENTEDTEGQVPSYSTSFRSAIVSCAASSTMAGWQVRSYFGCSKDLANTQ
jgi:hypothetical protein